MCNLHIEIRVPNLPLCLLLSILIPGGFFLFFHHLYSALWLLLDKVWFPAWTKEYFLPSSPVPSHSSPKRAFGDAHLDMALDIILKELRDAPISLSVFPRCTASSAGGKSVRQWVLWTRYWGEEGNEDLLHYLNSLWDRSFSFSAKHWAINRRL